MQIRYDKTKPKPSTHQFASVEGHKSLIDREAIQKSNEAARKERLLKAVGDGVNALGEAVRNHKAKLRAGKLLSEEN